MHAVQLVHSINVLRRFKTVVSFENTFSDLFVTSNLRLWYQVLGYVIHKLVLGTEGYL